MYGKVNVVTDTGTRTISDTRMVTAEDLISMQTGRFGWFHAKVDVPSNAKRINFLAILDTEMEFTVRAVSPVGLDNITLVPGMCGSSGKKNGC